MSWIAAFHADGIRDPYSKTHFVGFATNHKANHNQSFQIESRHPTWSAAFHADGNHAPPVTPRFVSNAKDIVFKKGAKCILKCAYKVWC